MFLCIQRNFSPPSPSDIERAAQADDNRAEAAACMDAREWMRGGYVTAGGSGGGGGGSRSEGGVWEGSPPLQEGHPDFFEESMVDEFAGMFQDSDSD
jgi:hypothetical protein